MGWSNVQVRKLGLMCKLLMYTVEREPHLKLIIIIDVQQP